MAQPRARYVNAMNTSAIGCGRQLTRVSHWLAKGHFGSGSLAANFVQKCKSRCPPKTPSFPALLASVEDVWWGRPVNHYPSSHLHPRPHPLFQLKFSRPCLEAECCVLCAGHLLWQTSRQHALHKVDKPPHLINSTSNLSRLATLSLPASSKLTSPRESDVTAGQVLQKDDNLKTRKWFPIYQS